MAKMQNPLWQTTKTERKSYYSYFFGQNMIYHMIAAYLTTFLILIGVDPFKSASVVLVVKIWDAVNDAVFGVIFDKIKFKSNQKYIPWLKIACALTPAATIALFIIPTSTSETVKLIWFALAYIVWDTAYTLCDVPAFGIITAMTSNIEERIYHLVGMQVFTDETPGNGEYGQFTDGSYVTSLTGKMYFSKCTIDLGREKSVLIFKDDSTGIYATYTFSVYTDQSKYPAYSFESYSVKINDKDAKNMSETEINELSENVADIYKDTIQFGSVCEQGDVSIQLITQNKSFACAIIIKDKQTGDLWFMGQIFGY